MAEYEKLSLAEITARMRRARQDCGLPEAVESAPLPHIVAVSKTQPGEAILPFLAQGHRIFGENRVQEAAAKWPALREKFLDIELHLLGPLQTNKVKEAVALFDVIETLDRPRLAEALAAEMARQGKRPACFIQVNTGEEPQKAGIPPRDLPELLDLSREKLHLPVAGLMCIPPAGENPAPHFALLKKLAERHNLPELSMGMSADYAIAATLGATYVRVGSAIFGERVAGVQ